MIRKPSVGELATSPRAWIDVTILAGSAVSDVIDVGKSTLVGILTPDGLQGNEFAFDAGGPNAAGTGVGMFPLYDMVGTRLTAIYDAVARYIDLDERLFYPVRFIRLITRTTGAQTAQVADVTMRLIVG